MKDLKSYLESVGQEYKDFGTFTPESCDYPAMAVIAADAIVTGVCDKGIFICGTGIGISIAANKIHGIRAAVCTNCFMAEMARRHNDANVLALGGRVVDAEIAKDIVKTFLDTDFSTEERHRRRVAMLIDLDKKG